MQIASTQLCGERCSYRLEDVTSQQKNYVLVSSVGFHGRGCLKGKSAWPPIFINIKWSSLVPNRNLGSFSMSNNLYRKHAFRRKYILQYLRRQLSLTDKYFWPFFWYPINTLDNAFMECQWYHQHTLYANLFEYQSLSEIHISSQCIKENWAFLNASKI